MLIHLLNCASTAVATPHLTWDKLGEELLGMSLMHKLKELARTTERVGQLDTIP